MKLVQCVPNFSEGRDKAKVEAIVAAIKSSAGVLVLDVEMDPDHNRCVITFAGEPDAVLEGAFLGAGKAVELIDMRRHKGEHPRIGATDVIPFTPIAGVSIEDCVSLAKRLGERLARELKIPVYLYGFAAAKPERENLANVRKGEYEGLSEAMGKDSSRDPDYGQPKMHPSAGATAVGARDHIINFNVNLKSNDMELAKTIAKRIRSSSGGLPHLRAKEIHLAQAGKVQISTVLTNYRATSLDTVFHAARSHAHEAGVEVSETELIGMVPAGALADFALSNLMVANFNASVQVLESRLTEILLKQGLIAEKAGDAWGQGLEAFCNALAAAKPVPGGGSAAAGIAAIGVSLALKACAIQQKKNTKEGKNGQEQGQLNHLVSQLTPHLAGFLDLARKDSASYQGVVEAYRAPKIAPEREARIQEALKQACEIPLQVLHLAVQSLASMVPSKGLIHSAAISDYKVGIHSLVAASLGAKENVYANLGFIESEQYRAKTKAQTDALEASLRASLGG